MSSLVVYYSKTGNTKKVGDIIASILKADTEQLIDKKKRTGFLGYVLGGRDGLLKKGTEIETIKHDPKNYDIIAIGTPVWSWNIVPAIRSYLKQNPIKGKKVILFATMGSSGDKKSYEDIKKLIPENKFLAEITFTENELKEDITKDIDTKLKEALK